MIEVNQLYHGDCMKLLNNIQQVDCLMTDIPYDEVNKDSNGLRVIDKGKADKATFNLQEFLPAVDKKVKGVFVIFCGIEQVSRIYSYFRKQGYSARVIVWEKTNPSPMNGEYIYLSNIELCVYAKKSGGVFNGFCKGTVFKCKSGKSDLHPTQKPVELIEQLLLDNTNEGDLVLDTCCGSGTIPLACWNTRRNFIGFELDKEYYDIAVDRLKVMQQLRLF